jgi:hypothetical protein
VLYLSWDEFRLEYAGVCNHRLGVSTRTCGGINGRGLFPYFRIYEISCPENSGEIHYPHYIL